MCAQNSFSEETTASQISFQILEIFLIVEAAKEPDSCCLNWVISMVIIQKLSRLNMNISMYSSLDHSISSFALFPFLQFIPSTFSFSQPLKTPVSVPSLLIRSFPTASLSSIKTKGPVVPPSTRLPRVKPWIRQETEFADGMAAGQANK